MLVEMPCHICPTQRDVVLFERTKSRFLRRTIGQKRRIEDYEAWMRAAMFKTINKHPDLERGMDKRPDTGPIIPSTLTVDDDVIVVLRKCRASPPG